MIMTEAPAKMTHCSDQTIQTIPFEAELRDPSRFKNLLPNIATFRNKFVSGLTT